MVEGKERGRGRRTLKRRSNFGCRGLLGKLFYVQIQFKRYREAYLSMLGNCVIQTSLLLDNGIS